MIAIHFKRLLNIKSLLLYYALILVLFLLLTSIFNNFSERLTKSDQIRLGIVSEDTHALAQVLLDSFKNSPQFTALFKLQFDSSKVIKNAFETDQLDAYVVIPTGFTEGLLTYNNQSIDLYGHLENPLKNQLIASILSGYASYIDASNAATWSLYFTMKDAKLPTSEIVKVNNAFSFEMIGATLGRGNYFEMHPVSELPMLSSISYFALALPFGLITLTTLTAGTQAIINRNQAVHKRLAIAGQPYIKQIIAEHMAQWLHGLLLLLPAFAMLLIFMPKQFVSSILLLSLSWWLWQSGWRLFSLLTDDVNAYVMTASSMAFVIVLGSGGFIPFLMLPDWLKGIGSYLPNMLLMQVITQPQSAYTIQVASVVLIIIIALFIALEARLTALKLTGGR